MNVIVFGSKDAMRIAADNQVLAELVEYLVQRNGLLDLEEINKDHQALEWLRRLRCSRNMDTGHFDRLLKLAIIQARNELVQP